MKFDTFIYNHNICLNSAVIKISLQLANQQTMKGVKINNYIDNRIVLSGRKLKDEVQAVQTLIHSHRNQPLVIRNLHYDKNEEGQLIQDKQTTRHMEPKSNKKKRKRTKTSTNNLDIKFQANQKQQKKVNSREGQRKITSAKKKSPESSASKGSVVNFNQTEKKLIKVCKSTDRLGRSKSTIIKGIKYPFPEFQKKHQLGQKINFDKKEIEINKKKSVKKDKKSSGKGITKKNPQINISVTKKNKPEKQEGLKSSRPKSRPNLLTTKSKLDSARQNKNKQQASGHKGKKLMIQKQKKREKKQKKDKDHITIQQMLEIQKKDFTLKDALSKLEEAINKGGKSMQLSQKLQILAERLNQLNEEDLQGSVTQRQTNRKKWSNVQMRNNQIRASGQINCFTPHQKSQKSEKKQQSHSSENQADSAFTNTKIADNILKKQDKNEDEKELNSQSQQDSQSQEQMQIPIEVTQEKSEKNLESINKQMEAKREIYKKDPDNFREIINRNGIYDEQVEQDNPLIGRKVAGDTYIDLADYDSINSVKSNLSNIEKMQEINQLKKFQEESDQMMKRIKQLEGKKKNNEEQKNNTKQIKLENKSEILNGQKSPKGIEVKDYAFEKYPKTIQGIKSPKFSSHQILQVVKLKQKIFTDRHEKLSELVNVMFDKKIVSPKTYSIHIQTLREQQVQNNEVMDNYKKHAEELAQLLSQIKKQKEQITNIDEMIRSENWDEAVSVIKSNQKKIVIKNKPEQTLIKPYILPKQQDEKKSENDKSRELQQEINSDKPFYYDGQNSEEGNVFQLIPVEQDLSQVQPSNVSKNNSSLIKIDQGDVVNPKRRGFDSNLFFIKEYCIALCQYVRDNHKQDFMFRIGNPMSYDLPKLLKTFRTNKDGSPAISINSLNEDLSYHDCNFHYNSPPISNKIFAQFNKSYPNIKYYCKETSKDAQLQGIFLNSIYDALNESISIQKPSSTNGKALPWAQSSKHLKNLKNSLKNSQQQRFKNQESQDLIFGIAIARIIQWGSCLCGFIPDTVELQNTQIDEQYINHIRETRTALLLQKMLVDQQATMYKVDLEQTEVKLCLGQIICDQLISQIAQDMKKIVLRATIRSIDY